MDVLEFLARLSTLFAAVIAIYGIDSWRREHTSKKKIDLAEETLATFYEARDAIRYIRNPGSFTSETDHVVRGDNESDGSFFARKQASVAIKRINDKQELFSKLHALRYRFMSQVGKEQAKPFEDLHAILSEIQSAAFMLSRLWNHERMFPNAESSERHEALVTKHEEVFWEGLANVDAINLRLDALLKKIEATCRSTIEGQGTLFSIINVRIRRRRTE